MITIQQVDVYHLEEVFKLFKDCKRALEVESIFQWTERYPNIEVISHDISAGHLYGLFSQNNCCGVVCLNTIQDSEYSSIRWQDSTGLFLAVHRLAILPSYQKQGFATQLMDFAEDYALKQGINSIRLDTYSANRRALKLYMNRGYTLKGEVYFPDRELPFICMEKILR